MKIPFNKPYMTGRELDYIREAHDYGQLSGNGPFTKKCQAWFERQVGCNKALLTHSCTAALEMAAILADIQPGDEVIMPSYTFVSTANAFVLRGGIPVFIDIREDTLNMDETLIEGAITDRTKAIVPVHYAGVACEMDTIMQIARRHGLLVIEDAAQSIMSAYKGRTLGAIGDMGSYSFHETKNITSGEGGALLLRENDFGELADIIWEKGTDRARFFKGQVDKYTWQHMGSSFLPGELIAAFLWAQIEVADILTKKRLAIWNYYHRELEVLQEEKLLKRPFIPGECRHNAHLYHILLPDSRKRDGLLRNLNREGINALFHYIPLHSSPAGKRYGRVHGEMKVTDCVSRRIVRLPLWVGMDDEKLERIISLLFSFLPSA